MECQGGAEEMSVGVGMCVCGNVSVYVWRSVYV